MKYLLILGISNKSYKSPFCRVYINKTWITDYDLSKDIQVKKVSTHDFDPYMNPDAVDFPRGKNGLLIDICQQYLVCEIDDSIFASDSNKLILEIKDSYSNYTNGFITRAHQYFIHNVMLVPTDYFKSFADDHGAYFKHNFLRPNNIIEDVTSDNDDGERLWPGITDRKLMEMQYSDNKPNKSFTLDIEKRWGIYLLKDKNFFSKIDVSFWPEWSRNYVKTLTGQTGDQVAGLRISVQFYMIAQLLKNKYNYT